ncbi:MAG: peptide ABC transporter substrate-binding protein [Deltaproteobacteria bacterium CG_4_10_14_3_um_filter_60_8]|nr:MAG: peptide ABC transporter substrate-binding protein [Desulfobacterales bacterium CG2_30_60_27]PIP43560.1 MAG: peptide ABC transporter substrate-binding protein [Deltaproteobacteria bacterium CG23_combo_of_CG06-09_8_20_14_all_60_8]PIY24837.1 MAG: peptide ABC transporter substrate-binding protein [Deltaproteobacteria bacterium CG_4_10_14_3_um_filter_60_8]
MEIKVMRYFLCIILVMFCWTSASSQATAIIDTTGRTIEVTKPFTRIISLYGAHTENLFSLGLDTEIIGVSNSEDYPPKALKKETFDYRGDAEKFLAARPDLVLVRPMIERSNANLVEKLQQAGITVVSLQPANIDETFAYWHTLGVLTGREQAADSMVQHFKEEYAKIEKIVTGIPATARQRVYFESIHAKMKTFTPESMAMFALTSAGGVNIATDAEQVRSTNIAAYGKEPIMAKAAEIDVFLAQKGAMNIIDIDTIVREPGFAAIKAVRENKVYLIDERLVSRPTMRLLDGMHQIGELLYPNYFKTSN